MHFINLSSGSEDAVFFAPEPREHVMVDRNGYYLSSQRSAGNGSFFMNGRPYEFGQFDLLLNRPDKVLATLGYADQKHIDDLRKAMDTRLSLTRGSVKSVNEAEAPLLELRQIPDLLSKDLARTITFRVVANAMKDPINRIRVTLNGDPVFGSRGKYIKPQLHIDEPITLTLSPGLNQIAVSVTNKSSVSSLTRSFNILGPEDISKPDLYIVGIACGDYLQKNKNLKYPVKDARDIVALFKKQSANYAHIFIDTLFDKRVTRPALSLVKNRLLRSKSSDHVVIYYAGHGLQDDKFQLYLSTFSTDFANPAKASIPDQVFGALADSIPARHKLVLLDACNGGEVNAQLMGNTKLTERQRFELHEKISALMDSYFAELRPFSGAAELSASGPFQKATERTELGNGVFTYFLKQAFNDKRSDLNSDGRITASELSQYLSGKVSELTGQEQKPTLRHTNVAADPVVWW